MVLISNSLTLSRSDVPPMRYMPGVSSGSHKPQGTRVGQLNKATSEVSAHERFPRFSGMLISNSFTACLSDIPLLRYVVLVLVGSHRFVHTIRGEFPGNELSET